MTDLPFFANEAPLDVGFNISITHPTLASAGLILILVGLLSFVMSYGMMCGKEGFRLFALIFFICGISALIMAVVL